MNPLRNPDDTVSFQHRPTSTSALHHILHLFCHDAVSMACSFVSCLSMSQNLNLIIFRSANIFIDILLRNKNTFCGKRYLSHCCSLHGTVLLSRRLILNIRVATLTLRLHDVVGHLITLFAMFHFLYVLFRN